MVRSSRVAAGIARTSPSAAIDEMARLMRVNIDVRAPSKRVERQNGRRRCKASLCTTFVSGLRLPALALPQRR